MGSAAASQLVWMVVVPDLWGKQQVNFYKCDYIALIAHTFTE